MKKGDDWKSELKINDNLTDFYGAVGFSNIIISDEFIVVITHGTDVRSHPIYIFDYNGNTLFKTYYLNNKGMVITSGWAVSVDGNRILMPGDRWNHGISLVMEANANYGDFSEYYDYLYEDILYDYGNIGNWGEVYLGKSNMEEVIMLNKDEIVAATFELEYIGGGKFSKIKMTDYTTLEEMEFYNELIAE